MSDGQETCRLCPAQLNDRAVMCFDDKATGKESDVVVVLNKHFWFELNQEKDAGAFVCRPCWRKVDAFHQFYQSVLGMYQTRVKSEPIEDDLSADAGHTFEITQFNGSSDDADYNWPEDVDMSADEMDEPVQVPRSLRLTIELPPLDIKSEELADDPLSPETAINSVQCRGESAEVNLPATNEPSQQSDDDQREEDSSTSSSTLPKNRTQFSLSRLQNRRLRDTTDPFGLPEVEFRRMFRLSRPAARDLLDELMAIEPSLQIPVRRNAIPFQLKFLTALNFLAHGSFQKLTGTNSPLTLSQATVSRCLSSLLTNMMALVDRYIKFPKTLAEISRSKMDFMQRLQMPGIVCAFACRHVRILKPSTAQNGHLYCNRMGFHSLNVLAACNARQQFVFADATSAGAVLDAAIYRSIELDKKLAPNAYVLGDRRFEADRCMLTPVDGAAAGSKEEHYNAAHRHAHNAIARAYGGLQRRFRCLNAKRTLHYRPETAVQIVYACMVLHNICQQRSIPVEGVEAECDGTGNEEDAEEVNGGTLEDSSNCDGRRARDNYIQQNF